jgi:hypothetical protein
MSFNEILQIKDFTAQRFELGEFNPWKKTPSMKTKIPRKVSRIVDNLRII